MFTDFSSFGNERASHSSPERARTYVAPSPAPRTIAETSGECRRSEQERLNRRQAFISVAKDLKTSRDARASFLDADLFHEPAWDILLVLFIAAGEQCRRRVTDVCNDSRAPASTCLRYITLLEQKGYVSKQPNVLDGRVGFLSLTKLGEDCMRALLSDELERQRLRFWGSAL